MVKQVTAVSRIIERDCDDGGENDGKVMESDIIIISGIDARRHEDQSPRGPQLKSCKSRKLWKKDLYKNVLEK